MVWMAGRERMTRDGKLAVAMRRRALAPRHFFIAALLSLCGAGHAAGLASALGHSDRIRPFELIAAERSP